MIQKQRLVSCFVFALMSFVGTSCGQQIVARATSAKSYENRNPIEGMRIEIYMPVESPIVIDTKAINEVSRNLRLGEVVFTNQLPAQLGYSPQNNTLFLQFDLKNEQVYDPSAGGYLLGYSDPVHISVFWVSMPQLEMSYLKYIKANPGGTKTKDQYLTNAFSYIIAHEVFNHEIGIAIMTRPFQLDMYDEVGTLNSAEPRDVWENTARNLSPSSAYLVWKRRKGYP